MKCLVLALALVAALAICEGKELIKPGRQEDEVYLVQLLVSPAKVKDGDKSGIPDKTSPIVARLLRSDDKNDRARTRRSPKFKKSGYGGCCGGGGGGYPSGGGGLGGGGGGSGSWSHATASASSGSWGNGYGGGKGNYGK